MWSAMGPGVVAGVVVSTAATIEKETSFTNAKLEDVAKDVQQVMKLVKLLVRRQRKVDMKTDVAVRRLERLKRETDEKDDQKHEASLTDALADKSKVVKLVVDKWFCPQGLRLWKSADW